MPPERVQMGLLNVANQLEVKQREFAEKQGVRRRYGEPAAHGKHGSEAICHSKILEAYAQPGQVIIGIRQPHAARRRGGVRRLRRRHHGDLQLVDHEGRARRGAAVASAWWCTARSPTNVTAKDFMLEILRHPYIKDGARHRPDHRVRRPGGARRSRWTSARP